MAPTSIRQVRHALGASSLAEVEEAVASAVRSDTLTIESFAAALRETRRETPAPA